MADSHIELTDEFLAPGYGRTNPATLDAMRLAARLEGLIVDPTYTAKCMAGFIDVARKANGTPARKMLFVHTGGQPAIFGSEPGLSRYFSDS